MFPETRMRRLRRTEGMRRLSEETVLTANDLIEPVFVAPGTKRREDVASMPGVTRMSPDLLDAWASGLKAPAVLVFGVPDDDEKDETGSAAAEPEGLVPQAVKAIRAARPDLTIITDVCLCGYTTHGHCGPLTPEGEIHNDGSIDMLGRMAAAHGAAGADMAAPSAMMDGQVQAIRMALDEAGLQDVAIMSYAAKFASAFYGPFRDAAHSAPSFGDRRSYQLPIGNRREAIQDALMDEDEGADWLMVKPAMPYLDIISDLRAESLLPLAAYQVRGEYSMIKLAAAAGVLDERKVALEALLCIKRAGADAVITYYADQACRWLAE